ncbi:MAG: sigma-70 family RNA polymerase sigma factor [bacterium]|nr:sigma-70 family RNA polymerase sigma factor [bacterium]MCW5893953.1 sigma-70 family RNA polymerase sigma factor [bacterium]
MPDRTRVVERLLAGERLAFLELNRLVTATLRQLRAWDFHDEWDDLRQEVLLAVVASAKAGRLRDPEACVGYVRIVTRNKFVDRLKHRLRWKETETLPWDDAAAHALATPPDDGERAALDAAVRDLAPDERRVLDGVYREGKTYQEVSDQTGIPLGTMKRRLRDALTTLRRRLAPG